MKGEGGRKAGHFFFFEIRNSEITNLVNLRKLDRRGLQDRRERRQAVGIQLGKMDNSTKLK